MAGKHVILRRRNVAPAGEKHRWEHLITIPVSVAGDAGYTRKTTRFAKKYGRTMRIHRSDGAGRIPIRIVRRRTRDYGDRTYYNTEFILPVALSRGMRWKSGIRLLVSHERGVLRIRPA